MRPCLTEILILHHNLPLPSLIPALMEGITFSAMEVFNLFTGNLGKHSVAFASPMAVSVARASSFSTSSRCSVLSKNLFSKQIHRGNLIVAPTPIVMALMGSTSTDQRSDNSPHRETFFVTCPKGLLSSLFETSYQSRTLALFLSDKFHLLLLAPRHLCTQGLGRCWLLKLRARKLQEP